MARGWPGGRNQGDGSGARRGGGEEEGESLDPVSALDARLRGPECLLACRDGSVLVKTRMPNDTPRIVRIAPGGGGVTHFAGHGGDQKDLALVPDRPQASDPQRPCGGATP
jgi:hypothetical protein